MRSLFRQAFKIGRLVLGSPSTGYVSLYTNAGAPTNGTSGTLAGIAGVGSVLFDTTNGAAYINTNTKASPTWSATSVGGTSVSATLSLAASDITTLHSVPFNLVAAPGAGKLLVFEELVWEFTFGTTQFTGGGAVTLQYNGASVNLMHSAITQASVQNNANSLVYFGKAQTANGIVGVSNQALQLIAAGADFAGGGDSTAKVFFKYRVVTL